MIVATQSHPSRVVDIPALNVFASERGHNAPLSNDFARRRSDHGHGRRDFGDRSSVQPFSRDSAHRLLAQQIFSALNGALGTGLRPAHSPFETQSTIASLASQLSAALQGALAGRSLPLDVQSREALLEKGLGGVDDGVAATRGLIAEQGPVPESVERELQDSQQLLRQSVEQVVTSRVAFETSRSATVSIQTQDGDSVHLNFGQSVEGQQTSVRGDSSGVTLDATSSSLKREQSLSFTVEGALDEGELRAIRKLFQRVEKIADKLFDGQMDAVMKRVDNFKFDTSELAGVAIDLSVSRSVEVSQASVTTFTSPPAGVLGAPANENIDQQSLRQIADTAGELRTLLAELREEDALAEPQRAVYDVASTVFEHKSADELTLAFTKALLEKTLAEPAVQTPAKMHE